MPGYGTHEAAYLRDAAWPGVDVGAGRPREARPNCKDELARGGLAQCGDVEGGGPTGDAWERVVRARR